MIRLILFVVVGLLAGLGAGTGFAVLKAKSAFATESAKRAKIVADSLAEHEEAKPAAKPAHEAAPNDVAAEVPTHAETVSTEHAPKTVVPSVKGTPTPVTAPEPTHKGTAGAPEPPHTGTAAAPAPTPSAPSASKHVENSAEGAHAPGVAAAVRPPVTTGASKGDEVVQPKRISKIFAAMPARDAAKVLVQMDDADVRLILDALGEKQAAAILQNFPADRAATISKSAIRGTRTP